MDHSQMDHGHMDHGDMGHGDMGSMCSMNMVFTWSFKNLCIVFPQWRVTSTWTYILSIIAVIALSAIYEWVRLVTKKFDHSSEEYVLSLPTDGSESSSSTWLGKNRQQANQKSKLIKAALYALQIFYSFFIMLIFMTYNGGVMISVAVGAFLGYLAFGDGPAAKDISCH